MPAVTRIGDRSTGHDACSPVPLATGSADVFVNGVGAGRIGDQYNAHGCDAHASHRDTISDGSASVFVNGIGAGRIGDRISTGGSVAQGSSDVFMRD